MPHYVMRLPHDDYPWAWDDEEHGGIVEAASARAARVKLCVLSRYGRLPRGTKLLMIDEHRARCVTVACAIVDRAWRRFLAEGETDDAWRKFKPVRDRLSRANRQSIYIPQ